VALYALWILVLSGFNRVGAERWWFGAFNLYLPQVVWAVPGALLLAAAVRVRSRWAWVAALCLGWVLGPVMGFHWTGPEPARPGAPAPVRVMTCNAKYGPHDGRELIKDIERHRPQLVLLQDAPGILHGPLAPFFRGWKVCSFEQYVIASRGPVTDVKVLWARYPGGKLPVLRCVARLEGKPVACYSVHLQSPRESLNAFRPDPADNWRPLEAIRELEQGARVRFLQAQALRRLVEAETGAVLVAGDLNSPEASRVCATLEEAGLQDAFSQAGRGYGYTYGHFLLRHRIPWLHWSWMRLDHLLASRQIQVLRCWVGTRKASDHRPVFADLVWR
jgi:endonuclease/exonuclease/phosphatase (EEP) superfamily protein YafD